MSIQIKITKNSKELDEIYQLRHRVFVEEEHCYKPREGGRFFDFYDMIPTTCNLVALQGDQVIGNLRLTQHSQVGSPGFDVYDYSPHLPYTDERIISSSMLCIEKSHRKNVRLLLGMMMMGYYWAKLKDATHLLAPINPRIKKTMEYVGFTATEEEYEVSPEPNRIVITPMVLDMAQGSEMYEEYCRMQKLPNFQENFKRELYDEGEVIIKKGEEGRAAYVIVQGEVDVKAAQQNLATLKTGEVFGEIALLTAATRTADVIAKTPVDLMVLERDDFQKQIIQNPKNSAQMLQIVGQRLKETLEKV